MLSFIPSGLLNSAPSAALCLPPKGSRRVHGCVTYDGGVQGVSGSSVVSSDLMGCA